MIDRPVLFIGATRSGKSMLADILGQLPEFEVAFEPLGCWNAGFRDQGSDVRTQADATPEIVDQIRTQIERFLDDADGDRYVDDLPHHALRMGFCDAVLPDARYVFVARDAAATIRDMKYGWEHKDTLKKVLARRVGGGHHKTLNLRRLPGQAIRWSNNAIRRRLGGRRSTWGPTAPGQIEFSKGHTLVETIAFQWAGFVSHALDGLGEIPDDRVLMLKYEEVLADPAGQAARLGAFCGAQNPDALVDLVQRSVDTSREPYGEALSPDEIELIGPIITPIKTRLGYTL